MIILYVEGKWEGLCKVIIAFEAQYAASIKTSEINLNLWAHDQDYMADGQGAPQSIFAKKGLLRYPLRVWYRIVIQQHIARYQKAKLHTLNCLLSFRHYHAGLD